MPLRIKPKQTGKILIRNIRQLVQVRPEPVGLLRGFAMNDLPVLENAYLLIENGRIADFGRMEEMPVIHADETVDAAGRLVMPAWVDSHTHTVFAASRYGEFMDKIKGLSYAEIAAKGGGILNSAKQLEAVPEDELLDRALQRVLRMMQYGTGALEIKSGYGLSVNGELKMLRVIGRLKTLLPIPVKATFLGAHAIPEGMSKEDYMKVVLDEMLPEIASQNLADYVDIFCEKGYFNVTDLELLAEKAGKYGLKLKAHVNQFTSLGGVATAVKHEALSVDHLEVMTETDFEALERSETIATVLPGCSFFLKIPYAPAKRIIERNIPLALATDFNPGSAPSWNMNFMVSLACIKQGLTPEQAINAATVNAAAAMELSHEAGQIVRGMPARVFMTIPLNHYGEIPYYFATRPVDRIFY